MSAYPTDNTSSTIPAAINNTGGTYSESAFLSIVIPEIEASPAFQDNGLIVVTYDEAYPPFTLSSDSQANSNCRTRTRTAHWRTTRPVDAVRPFAQLGADRSERDDRHLPGRPGADRWTR